MIMVGLLYCRIIDYTLEVLKTIEERKKATTETERLKKKLE